VKIGNNPDNYLVQDQTDGQAENYNPQCSERYSVPGEKPVSGRIQKGV
jgi:hypothetical protein